MSIHSGELHPWRTLSYVCKFSGFSDCCWNFSHILQHFTCFVCLGLELTIASFLVLQLWGGHQFGDGRRLYSNRYACWWHLWYDLCGGIRVTCFSQPKFKGYLNSRKVNMQHKDKLSPLAYSDPFPTFSEVIYQFINPKVLGNPEVLWKHGIHISAFSSILLTLCLCIMRSSW